MEKNLIATSPIETGKAQELTDYYKLCGSTKQFYMGNKSRETIKKEAEQLAETCRLDSKTKPVVINNKEYNLPYLFALYRANVNPNFTVLELFGYNAPQIVKIIILGIWQAHLQLFSERKESERKKAKRLLIYCLRTILFIDSRQVIHNVIKRQKLAL